MIIDVELIDPFSLPLVTLEEREKLPKVCGIYFAISKAEILYIGKSVDLRYRWRNHHRTYQLQTYGNVIIAWLDLSDLEGQGLEHLEGECILRFKPLLNGRMLDKDSNTSAISTLFGKTLKNFREQQEMTQQETADIVGVKADRTIRRWENGTRFPSIENLKELARAFGVEVKDLFDFPNLEPEV